MNTVFGVTADTGTTYDGGTELLSTQTPATPGSTITLVFSMTMPNQQQRLFDSTTGRMTEWRDGQGRRVLLSYNGSGLLTAVTDASDANRRLTFSYTGGRISSVSDGSRTVSYSYSPAGDLQSVTDVRGQTTTYTYGVMDSTG